MRTVYKQDEDKHIKDVEQWYLRNITQDKG